MSRILLVLGAVVVVVGVALTGALLATDEGSPPTRSPSRSPRPTPTPPESGTPSERPPGVGDLCIPRDGQPPVTRPTVGPLASLPASKESPHYVECQF